jgi:hypothetical protein
MKSLIVVLFFSISTVLSQPFINRQAVLEGNNMRSYILADGVFNNDISASNKPGLEWPKGSGKYACFTAGITIAAYVNGLLRMAAASYSGEYRPGYCVNGQFITDSRFRHYKVKKGDNHINNPDWLNWGLMVPFGAPYSDINNNGLYEYMIDIPGYKGASETIFICLTDADSSRHTPSSGFGGGTKPLFAEIHLTSWCYDTLGYKNIHFMKMEIINKGLYQWDSTIFTIYSDGDLGDATDDYSGCDSLSNLGYFYNGDNLDGDGTSFSYGANPPAWGYAFLNCNSGTFIMSNCVNIARSGSPSPLCEREPGDPVGAFLFMKGFKKDGTPFVNITNQQVTKYCYSGEPETFSGCTMFSGRVENCDGLLTGNQTIPVPPGDKKIVMNFLPLNRKILPGSSVNLVAAQMVARGTDHKNSVTKLKQLSDSATALCQNGFVIGINQLANEIPTEFNLYQNYPNPFNPVTKIKFSIPKSEFVTIKIYDALGREITTLVNDKIIAGVYSVGWDGSAYPSGIYFLKLQTKDFTQTNKMILLK